MTAIDSRPAAALAAELHADDCEKLYARPPAWASEHHDRDRVKAERILARLAGRGWRLVEVAS